MQFNENKLTARHLGRVASIVLFATLSASLTACGGGGGGGGGGTVTNNGSLSNPQSFTLPAGGVSTVPPSNN